jgi:GR25 family glycosyltransferase involved in LPS biosynthesis
MRCFTLTLPETPERTEKARAHFRERNVDTQFFNGIHAEKFGLKTVFPYEVDNPGSGFNIGFKPTGIWLSHFMLWSALTLLHDEYYMILEVDAQFPVDWHSRLTKALNDCPRDFDMLYVGSCCCAGMPKTHIAGEVWDVRYPVCTHSYIVAKKALPVLISTQRKVYAPVDVSLVFHTLKLLKVYTILPSVCSQLDTILSP